MSRIIVAGGRPLKGTVRVPGAKNAVLPILAATLLTQQPVHLLDCPRLLDVYNMLEILRTLGCKTHWDGDVLCVDASGAHRYVMPEQLSKELRSSIFLLGPVLSRFKQAVVAYPGGCEIGNRPIDLHLSGLAALHVDVKEKCGRIYCDGRNMTGNTIHLDYPSVGATENIMMAAVAAKGETWILNAAREPEIMDLQEFLRAMGFQVMGAGTSTIHVQGGGVAKEAEYRIMPDRIVAGTYLCAAAMTAGDITLTNVIPEHLGSTIAKLCECGCTISSKGDTLRVIGPKRPREMKRIETLPHPGFPTDMQAQMFAVCSIAEGTSVIVENVFENRFKHAAEFMRMGGISTIKDRTAIIRGVETLTGARVSARDLRGGAALVLAGLRAEGETQVDTAEHIDRGYEALELRLKDLGADIRREREQTDREDYGSWK